ncbi:MAG: TIGR04076 family protein [Candidatus Thorarchaeota archaeon]
MIIPKYDIWIEIFESDGICNRHKVGEKFKFPEDNGKICQWLLDSMNSMIRVLKYGGTLPWIYNDTPYEKKIDLNGITTEFVRCPDPTAKIIAKITRTPSSNG